MTFTILDSDEAFHTTQSIIMQSDIDALAAGIANDGVISGGAVTAQGTPDMTVAVAAGVGRVGATIITIGAGNVTITAADGTNPRIDVIQVNSSGTKSAVAGTASATPKAPALSGTAITLAFVYVPAADTTIATNQITDKRCLVGSKRVSVIITLDGGGAAITTGVKDYIKIPWNFVASSWTIVAAQSGSIVVDIWKDVYANFPPTVADTITGTEKPTLASAQKNQDTSLSSFTTAWSKDDIIAINVDSATTVTLVKIFIDGYIVE